MKKHCMEIAFVGVVIATLILIIGLVGNMDIKMLEQEIAWRTSVQALEMEQEKAQEDIIRLQEQYGELEDRTLVQGIKIYDFYRRMHFEYMDELGE